MKPHCCAGVKYIGALRSASRTLQEDPMSDYRRWFVTGGTYFFTVVTCHRHPFFAAPLARQLLGDAFREILLDQPFEMPAIVVLPDHLHCLWSLPFGDCDYPSRWKAIKEKFTSTWLKAGGHEERMTASQKRRGHRGIWQRRYHEHTTCVWGAKWHRGATWKKSVRYTHPTMRTGFPHMLQNRRAASRRVGQGL